MKIAGTATPSSLATTSLNQKSFNTLLELIKPLSPQSALVHTKLLCEITLSIKEPLQASTLYHSTLLKDKSGFVLREAFTLPMELKKILTLKPLMPIQQLLTQLSQAKSPQEIALESISILLSQTDTKEEAKELLSQLLNLINTQEVVIPLAYESENAYVKFKKSHKENDLFKLPFEAYFQRLGIITGFVSFFKHKREAHLKVLTEKLKEELLSEAQSLPMKLFVTIDKGLSLSPSTALLDIQA